MPIREPSGSVVQHGIRVDRRRASLWPARPVTPEVAGSSPVTPVPRRAEPRRKHGASCWASVERVARGLPAHPGSALGGLGPGSFPKRHQAREPRGVQRTGRRNLGSGGGGGDALPGRSVARRAPQASTTSLTRRAIQPRIARPPSRCQAPYMANTMKQMPTAAVSSTAKPEADCPRANLEGGEHDADDGDQERQHEVPPLRRRIHWAHLVHHRIVSHPAPSKVWRSTRSVGERFRLLLERLNPAVGPIAVTCGD